MAKILVIDDDELFRSMLIQLAREAGHDTASAQDLGSAKRVAHEGAFDVILLDVYLPDGNGLDFIPELSDLEPAPEIIIITGAAETSGAELAIRSGAWDYIQKPSSPVDISLAIDRALQYREQKNSTRPVKALKPHGIVGDSPEIRACLDLVAQAADSDANVLISGETGTGKELFATAIHNNGPRAAHPFVVVDCAALPESLVESILFGHEKGAFTGADRSRIGLLKQADQGTLFLDEVGELPLSVQKSFLRGLQENRFRPVGGRTELESDFRIIGATNRNLGQMVDDGLFREDLLFRLQAISIHLPPLKDRLTDIKALVNHQMLTLCEHYGLSAKGFSAEFMDALTAYAWPGNVRELSNAMESALAAAGRGTVLFARHLPTRIRVELAKASLGPSPKPTSGGLADPNFIKTLPKWADLKEDAVSKLEKDYLGELLSQTGGDIDDAVRISGLSRSRLYQLMKKHNLSRPR